MVLNSVFIHKARQIIAVQTRSLFTFLEDRVFIVLIIGLRYWRIDCIGQAVHERIIAEEDVLDVAIVVLGIEGVTPVENVDSNICDLDCEVLLVFVVWILYDSPAN